MNTEKTFCFKVFYTGTNLDFHFTRIGAEIKDPMMPAVFWSVWSNISWLQKQ